MERSWKKIRVLPIGADTTPWIEDEPWRRSLGLVLERMEENQRRWLIALLSLQLGHGGIRRLSEMTGMDEKTIRTGRQELAHELEDCPPARQRRQGAGRKTLTQKDLSLESDFEELIRHDIAGDPGSSDTWVRHSLRELQKAMNRKGHAISHATIRTLLKKRGIRCKPTANALPDHLTRTATGSSPISRKPKKRSRRRDCP
jgi:hypothetical protein